MRNPWRMKDGPDNKINRNNFPMSFQYNGTFKYGKIYPIGLIRTIPGASYQIDSTLALNFMPTAFPIQTRQRAYVHFFYGRDRNFWKDYKDFVNGMNPDLVKPYIDESVTKARTGYLLDYLGVPTTKVGSYGNYISKNFNLDISNEGGLKLPYNVNSSTVSSIFRVLIPPSSQVVYTPASDAYINQDIQNSSIYSTPDFISSLPELVDIRNTIVGTTNNLLAYPLNVNNIKLNELRIPIVFSESLGTDVNSYLNKDISDLFGVSLSYPQLYSKFKDIFLVGLYSSDGSLLGYMHTPEVSNQGELTFRSDEIYTNVSKIVVYCSRLISVFNDDNYEMLTKLIYNPDGDTLFCYPTRLIYKDLDNNGTGIVEDLTDETSPYWRSGTTDNRKRIKLSAIPPRMYETIYNLYFRNPQNNPYILNGKPEYNVFIPTKDGGVDNNLYELRYRNWEDDFLTTAVQTPQQGFAPLVGLTDRGATVTLTNEDGSVTRYKTNLDENGNVIGIETTDSSEPLLTQALIDAVSYGISIEDLRNVNAMQKWLELNLRKGYQYKDIIEARWGISISYNELDLPEFIGGFTQEVGLQAVTQTTSHGDGIEGALGWQAGRMYAAGSGRSITHYCEEEGYIMALLTVVPVPNYSQLLPKHWFTRDLLDSYQPEFNHIGFQPITYKEVCPVQAFQESTENVDVLEQTFGYQRPWYEYFNQVDEVHGQFRTTFKDFLINRTFDVKPELSESFLLVDPEQVNDVFAVTSDDDKIIGAIEHRIVAKLPISLYAQARLE